MKSVSLKLSAVLMAAVLGAVSGAPASAAPGPGADPGPSPGRPGKAHDVSVEAQNKALIAQLSGALLRSSVGVHDLAPYFAPHMIAHDPSMTNGRAGMLVAIDQLRRSLPGHTLTVKHILADGDLVMVHSHLSNTPADEKSGLNRLDTYRIDRGVIVEHWAARANVLNWSSSGNSPFSDLYVYAGAKPVISRERVETNRLLVKALSEEVFGKQNFGLLDRFWSVGYLQHNPYVGNGRAQLAGALPFISSPGSQYRVVHALADGDLTAVCAHALAPGANPADEFAGVYVCDLYRVANLELVEHWDIVQQVPSTTASANSMVSKLYQDHERR